MTARRYLRSFIRRLGFDLVRTGQAPRLTLVGLRELDVKTIIDVGANTGQFARSIRTSFPEARLFCFEPLKEPFRELANWAAATGPERTLAFNTALGDRQGTIEISCNSSYSPSASILPSTPLSSKLFPQTVPTRSQTVGITTLDAALEEMLPKLEPDILVKLDVQGYEDRVIRGGAEVLSRAKACILEVLIDGLYEGQPRFEDLVGLLDRLGFSYAGNLDQYHAPDGHVVFLDAVFTRRDAAPGRQ